MGKSMKDNNQSTSSNVLLMQILLGFAGTVIAAYLGYLGVRATVEAPIHATQTAEAKHQTLPNFTPENLTVESSSLSVTEMPNLITAPIEETKALPIIISRPTTQDLPNILNIWDLTTYSHPSSPTSEVYSVVVSSDQKYRWGAIWCGKNREILNEILEPLSLNLLVNDEVLDESKILEFKDIRSGWHCNRWTTIISEWEPGTITKLELRYALSETIYDGVSYTQKGEYRVIIWATAE
jgi:hypothetical protein